MSLFRAIGRKLIVLVGPSRTLSPPTTSRLHLDVWTTGRVTRDSKDAKPGSWAPTYGAVMILSISNGYIGEACAGLRNLKTQTLLLVSFDRFINGDDEEKRAVAKQLYDAFSTVGWVYLKDHGIPQERVDEIFSLAKTFFDLPLKKKCEWRLEDAELNQGYTGDGDEANGGVDHKECYEHRRFRNPSCPIDSELPGFQSTIDSFYSQCYTLGTSVLQCLAIAMDLGDSFFEGITKRADPQLRLIHYPSIAKSTIEQEGHARIIPHTDFGLCTLLFQDNVGGLEVDPFHTGDFKPALPVPGTVLINIADLMQRLTNDRCRSTIHRVVSPKVSGDILPSRYSIPFFIHPDPEAMIDPIVKEEVEVKKYEAVNAGEWRTWNTRKNYGLAAPA